MKPLDRLPPQLKPELELDEELPNVEEEDELPPNQLRFLSVEPDEKVLEPKPVLLVKPLPFDFVLNREKKP